MFLDLHQAVADYVAEISKQTSTKNGNILSLTWGECLTYLQFLEIIHQRYQDNFKTFLSIIEREKIIASKHKGGSWEMDAEELELMNHSRILVAKLRLDIESFLTFTAVLLNKLTNYPQRYFKPPILRGVRCGSHHKFWKDIQIGNKIDSAPSADILKNVEWMQKNIIDFRDHLIMHTLKADQIERQLIRGFSYSPEKGGSIMTSVLYPDIEDGESKQYQSVELQIAVDKLKEFIPQVIEFYRSNKNNSILGLDEE